MLLLPVLPILIWFFKVLKLVNLVNLVYMRINNNTKAAQTQANQFYLINFLGKNLFGVLMHNFLHYQPPEFPQNHVVGRYVVLGCRWTPKS